jgi:tetratricopeptide (TPR) repeat protein
MTTFEDEWAAASAQMGQHEYGRARERFVAALEAAADDGERFSARALVARMDSATGELPAARTAIDAALAEAPVGLSARVVARLRQVEAIVTREEGQREAATDKFIALYDYCMQAELWDAAIDAAHHVAIAGDLEQQVAWAHKGIAAAEAGDKHGWLAVLWNNLGVTYEDLNQPADVLAAYEKAREYHYETGGPVQKLAADWAVGRAWRLNGDATEAQRWLERSLEAARARYADDPTPATAEWIAYGLQELARTARLAGEPDVARELYAATRAKWTEAKLESWTEGTAELDAEIAELTEPGTN